MFSFVYADSSLSHTPVHIGKLAAVTIFQNVAGSIQQLICIFATNVFGKNILVLLLDFQAKRLFHELLLTVRIDIQRCPRIDMST